MKKLSDKVNLMEIQIVNYMKTNKINKMNYFRINKRTKLKKNCNNNNL